MSRYIPMPAYPDRMPVDISFVFRDEKPAGKHGFVHADGEVLRFEDGTLAKFWGVNFNGGACFPGKDYAHQVATRLAQSGCNLVRFHQLDAEWDTPNIFAFTKGERVKTTRVLDPRSLDALDYLIFCLKQEGVYCYLDMNTYRKFKEGDGVEQVELLQDMGKPWCITDPKMLELQKEFATQIWSHYNPYTELCYKDDPVFVMTEIINECDLFLDTNSSKQDYVPETYYIDQFRQGFKNWLTRKSIQYDWENCALYASDAPLIEYKLEVTKHFYQEMYDHMRAIGVKIPITGTNWSVHPNALIKSNEDMDYLDNHHYFYDWKWTNNERLCENKSITSTKAVLPALAKMRIANKPFFVSEWDMPWPNSYRAEAPIYYAAIGALQDWSGFAVHTYSYSSRLTNANILGRELSTPVAGVPYREGIFSVWNDPAKFGLFYHAALITRRGDVSPADKKVAVYASAGLTSCCQRAYNNLLEQHRTATVFESTLPEGYDELVADCDAYPMEDKKKFVSDNGQLWRDLNKRIGAVDTPRTKVTYGMLGYEHMTASNAKAKPQSIQLNGMQVTCKTDFGVIALSSLTDAPIEASDNMLLSAIGRAKNTDSIFDGEKMLDAGRQPVLAEVIEADIAIKTEIGDKLKVWGVNAEGFYAGKLPTTYQDGVLSFRIGDEMNPACYYLIVKE